MFNVDAFVNNAVPPMATDYELIPEGEFKMFIDQDPKQLVASDEPNGPGLREISGTSEKTGRDYLIHQMELILIVDSDDVRTKLGRDRVTIPGRFNLDLDEAGKLTFGPNRNVQLGQLRNALGQNNPGWNPKQLLGAGPFIGRVSHRSYTRDGETRKIAEVRKFAPIRK